MGLSFAAYLNYDDHKIRARIQFFECGAYIMGDDPNVVKKSTIYAKE